MRFQLSTFFKALAAGVFLLVFNLVLPAGPAANGADIYKQKCSMCHGAGGKGYPALKTPDFTDPKVHASMTDKEVVEIIKNGKKGTAMVGFADQLKDEEIHALVTYLRSLNSSKKK